MMRPHKETKLHQRVWKNGIRAVMLASALFAGCSDNGTGPETKSQLGSVMNFKAYSADIHSVGLTWTAPADTSSPDFQQYQISAKLNSSLIGAPIHVSKNAASALVGNLAEGVVYSFDIVAVASPGSTTFSNSNAATVQWAPARRMEAGPVYQIGASLGDGGLEFFNVQYGTPRVWPVTSAYESFIDVVLDSSLTGDLLLKSADMVFASSGRHTTFSSHDVSSDVLDIGSDLPPALATYTQPFVTINATTVSSGRIYYAVGNDSNFVRILVQRNGSSSLISGLSPNRYVNIQLSYQFTQKDPFAKRGAR